MGDDQQLDGLFSSVKKAFKKVSGPLVGAVVTMYAGPVAGKLAGAAVSSRTIETGKSGKSGNLPVAEKRRILREQLKLSKQDLNNAFVTIRKSILARGATPQMIKALDVRRLDRQNRLTAMGQDRIKRMASGTDLQRRINAIAIKAQNEISAAILHNAKELDKISAQVKRQRSDAVAAAALKAKNALERAAVLKKAGLESQQKAALAKAKGAKAAEVKRIQLETDVEKLRKSKAKAAQAKAAQVRIDPKIPAKEKERVITEIKKKAVEDDKKIKARADEIKKAIATEENANNIKVGAIVSAAENAINEAERVEEKASQVTAAISDPLITSYSGGGGYATNTATAYDSGGASYPATYNTPATYITDTITDSESGNSQGSQSAASFNPLAIVALVGVPLALAFL